MTTRVVFDTNVLVSFACWPDSLPHRAVERALRRHVVVSSGPLFAEFVRTIYFPKFDAYLSVNRRALVVAALSRHIEFVEPGERITACRDAKDDKVLEAAVAGAATLIVSGDRDLMALHPFRGIRILAPRSALESALD